MCERNSAKPTILVIEDDSTTASLVETILNREGYRPLIAYNGPKGLEIVRSQAVDLILLDLMLPGIDGFEVLNRLRADPATAGLPVIVVSVKSQATDKLAATEVGADAYLTKPYDVSEMLSLVDSLLRRERKEEMALSRCAMVVGLYRRETVRTALYVGLTLTSQDEPVTLVDLHPFSTERSLLPGPPRPPVSLADPATVSQLPRLAVQRPSGLRILEHLEGRGKAGALTSRDVDALFDALQIEARFILASVPLDCPTDVLCQAAEHCTFVLLATRGDPDSSRGTLAALTMLGRSGVDRGRIGIVIVGPMATGPPEFDQRMLCSVPAEAGADHPAYHDLADWLRDTTRADRGK